MHEIHLGGQRAAGRVALVDDDDFSLVAPHHWSVYETHQSGCRSRGPYAHASIRLDGERPRMVLMHVLIMGRKGIDHRDHDGLNNQRSNLRPASRGQNGGNRRPNLKGSSQYKGVSWFKRNSVWYAYITVDRHRRRLGSFADETEAARAYDRAALAAWGEFAYLNFPDIPAGALLLDARPTAA